MPKRRSYPTYSDYTYYRREKERKVPSPLPYLLVALLAGAGLAYFHFIVFQSLQGKVSNAFTGAPMSGVMVSVRTTPSTPNATPQVNSSGIITATTGNDGAFSIDKLPPEPVLTVGLDGFAPQEIALSGKRSLDIKMVPNVLRGKVLSKDGKPVSGASVWAGSARTLTTAGGDYV